MFHHAAAPGAVLTVGRNDYPLFTQRMPSLFPNHLLSSNPFASTEIEIANSFNSPRLPLRSRRLCGELSVTGRFTAETPRTQRGRGGRALNYATSHHSIGTLVHPRLI